MADLSGLVVAVDGGGSKTDVVAVTLDGEVRSRLTGPGSSPHLEGLAGSVETIDALVREALGGAEPLGVDLFVSGLDLPVEEDRYRAALAELSWGGRAVVENDLFALLHSGTEEPDAIAVVCGTGINAVGLRRDGAQVRFASLGELSGDWGGGTGLGGQALWHAARDVDGRGPATLLTTAICGALGAPSVPALIEDIHLERRPFAILNALSPVVFACADAGDPVAQGLVDRQADEIVAYVRAITARLGLVAVPIVLGGGILRAGHARLQGRIAARVADVAPGSRLVIPETAPITGAALHALARAGASSAARDRARAELSC
ncbi:MAG: BadF/BadG/BcrA/BcrD ATPase family protein [Arachnia sp.]